jgi:hypothetical protein
MEKKGVKITEWRRRELRSQNGEEGADWGHSSGATWEYSIRHSDGKRKKREQYRRKM